ncbi:hypothetical protein MBEHAL_1009 [Halarchaeum acidiphilum MH1-52-1]|uniref:Uncharacterized protein n=1 Tax=Halarchaeum acidiphilum MH1-52-1 TaxID=1261545 RepID=U3A3M6_9EURY|nr:hypothetical protein [Halarchaeum acidiphilum]GAD52249.1 hypothetical protein MBEHAL_1009 [Halarchaeum acidiphilum MH1-52-1]
MSEKDITTYLAENPRMIGALFTLVLLLASAGNSAAMWGTTFYGP